MANMFNEDGTYNKTEWKAGDKITAVKLNKIELSLEAINNNDIDRHVEADSRLDILEERIANTPDNEQMDALEDMVKDNKDAADLAIYSINQKIESLESVNNCRITEGIQLTKTLSETYRGVPVYGGYRIPLYKSGGIPGTSDQQTITIELPCLNDYDKIIANFKIHTSAWDTGDPRMRYSAELYISAKTGSTVSVYKTPLVESVGFASEPSYSVDKGNKTLTITFKSNSSDATGIWVLEMFLL